MTTIEKARKKYRESKYSLIGLSDSKNLEDAMVSFAVDFLHESQSKWSVDSPKRFEITVGGSLKLSVWFNNGICGVDAAMDGWGDKVPVDSISVYKIPKPPK